MGRAFRALAALAFAAAALIVVAWAVTYLTWPFGWDHGAFAWVGDVIVRGGMPYRDAFDVKGPLSFYPSAFVQLVTGKNWWGIRAFDLVLLSLCAFTISRIAARFAGRTVAVGAALLWVLAYANTGFMNTAQPDAWVAWALLLALAPILVRERAASPAQLAVVGGAAALAALLKPHYAAFLLLPLLAAWLGDPARRTRLSLAAVAGFVVPIGAWLALAAATGTLGAFAEAVIRFNTEKNSAGLVAALSESLSYGFLEDPVVLLALPLAAAGIPSVARLDRRSGVLLGAWLVLALPLVLLQRPYYPYRLHIVTPVLAILAATAVARFAPADDAARPSEGRALLAGALLMLGVVAFGRHPLGEIARALALMTGRRDAAAHYARYDSWMVTAADERLGARFIRDSTPPGARVLAWNHPAVAFLADRPAAGRFSIETPVSARLDAPLRSRYLDSLHHGLAAAPPDVIVTEDTLGTAESCLSCLPPFAALGERGAVLAEGYSLRHRAGRLVI
ncbi:MAG: glycosyltransferase family 39 protein, partial [Gemmatimonadota bacterium]